MLRFISSFEIPKSRVVSGTAETKFELQKETLKVVRQMAMTAKVLRMGDQFIGFEGYQNLADARQMLMPES